MHIVLNFFFESIEKPKEPSELFEMELKLPIWIEKKLRKNIPMDLLAWTEFFFLQTLYYIFFTR